MIETVCWRSAVPGDEPFLFELFAEERAEQLAITGLGAAQLKPLIEMQYRGRSVTYTAQFPEAVDLILLGENGTKAGRLLVDRKPDCWRVVDIGVLASQRGRGLARQALEHCQEQCRMAGARLELQVDPKNPARRLYERLGFHVTQEDAVSVEMVWNPGIQGRRDEAS